MIYQNHFLTFTRIRGRLGSLLMVSLNSGMLAAFIIGHFCSYSVAANVQLILPLVFVVSFTFFPETPQYYLTNGNEEAS